MRWCRGFLLRMGWRLRLLFSSRQPPRQGKDYAILLSFVGQARLQFAGLHSLFLAWRCTVIEICGTMRRFTFLGFEDASFANFSSASHIFDNMRMLLIEIAHPQPALSITCRYSPAKLRIFNPRKSTIVDIPTKITSAPPVRQSSAV